MPDQFSDNERGVADDEISEVLGSPPSWIIRFGSILMLGLALLVIGLSFLISLPDEVTGKVVVAPVSDPKGLTAPRTGKLVHVYIGDRQQVRKEDILMTLEGIDPAGKAVTDTLRSPMDGTVLYQRELIPPSMLQKGMLLAMVLPEHGEYTATLSLSPIGAGSIQIGQPVQINLFAYSGSGYGELAGTVATLPRYGAGMATVDIRLTNGIVTTRQRKLLLYSPSEGIATITVSEHLLAKRIFSFLR